VRDRFRICGFNGWKAKEHAELLITQAPRLNASVDSSNEEVPTLPGWGVILMALSLLLQAFKRSVVYRLADEISFEDLLAHRETPQMGRDLVTQSTSKSANF